MRAFEDITDAAQVSSPLARCLTPLLDGMNWQGSESRLYQSMVGSRERMDTQAFIETLANLNFSHDRISNIKGHQINPDILPALVVDGSDAYVLLRTDQGEAIIFDGGSGTYQQTETGNIGGDLFLFSYTGDVSDSLLKTQANWFTKLIVRFSKSFWALTAITFLMTLLDLAVPMFVILIYSQIGSMESSQGFLMILIGVLVYFTSAISLNYIRSNIINYVSVRMGNIISHQTFRRLMYLSPSYTETASVSAQVSRIRDFENIKRFTNSGIYTGLIELVFSVIYIAAIFWLGGWIGFIPIVTFILVFILGFVMAPLHKVKMEKTSIERSKWQQTLLEILRYSEDIKATAMKDHWIKKASVANGKAIYNNLKQSQFVYMTNTIAYVLTNGSVIAIIYGGALQVMNGRMSTGALIGVVLLYWKVLASIRRGFSLTVQIDGLKRTVQQINRFMKLPQDNHYQSNKRSKQTLDGHLVFKGVSIRYNSGANPALLSCSFSVEPGEILGIEGHDGAGKSTIFKLILGMYVPQGGRILLDGQNIRQIEPRSLRQAISYASDRDMIFTGTIRDNFLYFNGALTDDEITEAASSAGLTAYLIRFGYSYDTYLDEEAIKALSPSFKKVFSLARMLARDVKLYLIDEPENYLTQLELDRVIMIINDLARYKGATVIVSTKSAEVMKICDKQLRINQGRLKEARAVQ